jgi:hypothetical protein
MGNSPRLIRSLKSCSMQSSALSTHKSRTVSAAEGSGLLFASLLSALLMSIPLIVLTDNTRRAATDSAASSYGSSGAENPPATEKTTVTSVDEQAGKRFTAPGNVPTASEGTSIGLFTTPQRRPVRGISPRAPISSHRAKEQLKSPLRSAQHKEIRGGPIRHVLTDSRPRRRRPTAYVSRTDIPARSASLGLASWYETRRRRNTESD